MYDVLSYFDEGRLNVAATQASAGSQISWLRKESGVRECERRYGARGASSSTPNAYPVMTRRPAVALCAALFACLTGPKAFGQVAHVAVTSSFSNTDLTFVEIEAGVVERSAPFNLTSGFGTGFAVNAVEFVGGEIWLATSTGLLRYRSSSPSLLGSTLNGTALHQIVPVAGGAVVFATEHAIEVDAVGVPQQRTPFPRREDVIAFQGGYLAIDLVGEIRRYDASFAPLATFGAGAHALAMAQSIFYQPDRLTLLSDGRVAVAAGVSIGIIDGSGAAENVFNPSQFEFDVIETASGLLYIPSALQSCLMDPDTGEAFEVGGELGMQNFTHFSQARRPIAGASSSRGCSSAPNSNGSGAWISIIASDSASDRSATLVTTGVPAGETTLLIFGDTAFNGPFGNGFLCVSPLGNVVRSSLQPASLNGTVSTAMDFATPGLGSSFVAGTSWTFQTLYRDRSATGAAVFNGSDSVTLSFLP